LAGLTVFVDRNGSGVLAPGDPTTTTDASGNYSFADLAPGAYTIDVQLNNPSERFTLPTGGNAGVTVGAGQTVTQNFGVQLFGFAGVVPATVHLFNTTNIDPTVAYVRGLYEAILGRDATDTLTTGAGQTVTEAIFWTKLIDSGQLTRAQVAAAIINAPEHRIDEVSYFYQTLLHRGLDTPIDPQSNYWVQQLLGGVSEAAVVQGIMDSPEFQNEHPDNTGFVQDLYFDVLGRQAGQDEIARTISQFSNGTTREQEEAIVINSPESAMRQVAGFYSAFFHRLPDTDQSIWVSALLAGASAGQVEAGMLVEQEFVNDTTATVP
jgi:hypothetical protein